MKALSKNDIIDVDDVKIETVEVPEWGGKVTIREFTAYARDQYELYLYKTKDTKNFRAVMVALSVIDENGDQMFSTNDVEALGQKSIKAMNRVYEACIKLNGVGAEAMEEAEKN